MCLTCRLVVACLSGGPATPRPGALRKACAPIKLAIRHITHDTPRLMAPLGAPQQASQSPGVGPLWAVRLRGRVIQGLDSESLKQRLTCDHDQETVRGIKGTVF
jgi:hypothetical protein